MSSPVYMRASQTEREFDAVRSKLRTAETPAKRGTDWRSSGFLILLIIVLAVPAVMAVWPRPALIAADDRGVVLTGPITAFEQSAGELRIRLGQVGEGRQLVVTAAGPGAAQAVSPAKEGWVSVKLPPSLVAASSLDVSIR